MGVETRWFLRGGREFEVSVDSPEHENLVAAGAEPIVAPDAAPVAKRGRPRVKPVVSTDEGTLGDE